MAFIITIAGTERQANIGRESFAIEKTLSDHISSCSFAVFSRTQATKPVEGQEVIVLDGTTRLFAGVIAQVNEKFVLPNDFVWEVQCTDYTFWLNKQLVVKEYVDKTLSEIVNDIVTNFVDSAMGFFFNMPTSALVGTAKVGFTEVYEQVPSETGPTIAKIKFNYEYVLDCFKKLTDITGWSWYVDTNKEIRFVKPEENAGAYTLTDAGTNYSDLTINMDRSQLRNEVYFRGGTYLSADYTDSFLGDGARVSFVLAYKPHVAAAGSITVTVNAVSKTLGIDNIDNGTKDFVVNYSEKTIKNDTFATLNNTQTLAVTYQYDIPILMRGRNQASIDAAGVIDGVGDGVYQFLIVDKTVNDRDLARKIINAELEKSANPLVAGSFKTTQAGWEIGQMVTINSTIRSVSNQKYLVNAVKIYFKNHEQLTFEVSFSGRLIDITGILEDLLRLSMQQIDPSLDTEQLEILRQLEDAITLTESLTTSTTIENQVGDRVGLCEVA